MTEPAVVPIVDGSGPASVTGARSSSASPAQSGRVPSGEAGAVCLRSFDPACGPVRWASEPQAATTATVAWELVPARPVAGEPFELVIRWADAEAHLVADATSCLPSNDGVPGQSQCEDRWTLPCDAYGMWPVPAPRPGGGETRHAVSLPAGSYPFDWSVTITAADQTVDGCLPPDPYLEAVRIAGHITVVEPPSDQGESSAPGRYEEWADNDASASWPDGVQASSTQFTRSYERLRFYAYLGCDETGECEIRATLTNVGARPILFENGLTVEATVRRCGGRAAEPATVTFGSAATRLEPGESTDAASNLSLTEPGTYCLVARTVITVPADGTNPDPQREG